LVTEVFIPNPYAESLRDLVTVQFSERGTRAYELQQQTWIHFVDFMDECAGM